MHSFELDRKRVGYCRDYARKILKKYNVDNPPIEIFTIAEQEGFIVKFLDQPIIFSGVLHRETKAIGINQNHHVHRQRFSLAHEMAHYFLEHPEEQKLHSLDESDKSKKVYEQEADEFAGEVLVPREILKREIKNYNTIEGLGNLFNISKSMLTIQIMKHGLLDSLIA